MTGIDTCELCGREVPYYSGQPSEEFVCLECTRKANRKVGADTKRKGLALEEEISMIGDGLLIPYHVNTLLTVQIAALFRRMLGEAINVAPMNPSIVDVAGGDGNRDDVFDAGYSSGWNDALIGINAIAARFGLAGEDK